EVRDAAALLEKEFSKLLTSEETFKKFFAYVRVLAPNEYKAKEKKSLFDHVHARARKKYELEKKEEGKERDEKEKNAGEKKLKRRLEIYLEETGHFYWDRPLAGQTCDPRAVAQLLSLLCDLPARWIFDIASGRKG